METHSRSAVEGRRLDGRAQKCVREFGSPENLHEHDSDWSHSNKPTWSRAS